MRSRWALVLAGIILTGCSSRLPSSAPVQAPTVQQQPAGASAPASAPATTAASQQQPASPGRADYDAALALIAKGDMKGARESLNRAVKADPNLAEAWNDLAYVEVHSPFTEISRPGAAQRPGRPESSAVQAARKALALKPDWPYAQFNLGIALMVDGLYADAIEPLRRSSEQQPDRPEPLTAYGLALLGTGKVDEAIAACSKAKALNPDFAPAPGCLAQARFGMKRLPDTEAALGAHIYDPAKGHFTSPTQGEWVRISPPDWCGLTYPDGWDEYFNGCGDSAPATQWSTGQPAIGTTPAGIGVGTPWSTVLKVYGETFQADNSREYAVADLILKVTGSEEKGVTYVYFLKPSAHYAFKAWLQPRKP